MELDLRFAGASPRTLSDVSFDGFRSQRSGRHWTVSGIYSKSAIADPGGGGLFPERFRSVSG